MNNLKIKITVSHNEVNYNYSIMCIPSILKVELNENRTKIWNEIKADSPNMLNIWAQQIWEQNYPNTFGKVIKVDILN
jgi:hypothetical protein